MKVTERPPQQFDSPTGPHHTLPLPCCPSPSSARPPQPPPFLPLSQTWTSFGMSLGPDAAAARVSNLAIVPYVEVVVV